jgi:hypothetical protein
MKVVVYRTERSMKILRIFIAGAVLLVGASAGAAEDMLYRHSVQANVAGLVFNRFGLSYEFRFTPKHALFIEAGGAIFSREKEHGAGLHYRLYGEPLQNARLLWIFKADNAIGFKGINIRWMKADGIYAKERNGQSMDYRYRYEASFVGVHFGKTYLWNSGFAASYRFGYGIPFGDFEWKDAKPGHGDIFDKFVKIASGLDFGLSFGYSF